MSERRRRKRRRKRKRIQANKLALSCHKALGMALALCRVPTREKDLTRYSNSNLNFPAIRTVG